MEDDATRLVWVTMLAMKDRHGEVMGSIPGLANVARVSVEACRVAIQKFLSPDPDSRTTDYEGRRIEAIQGGWAVLNHATYRDMDSDQDKRKKDAIRQQRARDKKASPALPRDEQESRRDGVTNHPSLPIQMQMADVDSDKKNTRIQARADDGDICAPSILSSLPPSDADHWQMSERNAEWSRALKAASCKIGRDNWTAWKSLVDENGLSATLSAAKGVAATERWPDRVESTLTASRGQQNPGDLVKVVRMSL